MVKLTAPYHFAPLNKKVYYPSWANQVSQDIPFSDGEDGYIEVYLKNVSPLFTRNGSGQNEEFSEEKSPKFSSHVMEKEGRRYFIPGSTLKGMLRSTMEIMAFGKMETFNDRYFAYRSFNNNDELYKSYHDAMGARQQGYDDNKLGCGWLTMDANTEELSITPCDGKFERIPQKQLNVELSNITDSYNRNEKIANKYGSWYPTRNWEGGTYHIVCTGDINSKEKEFLFPQKRLSKISVANDVKKRFFDVHEKPSPNFSKYLQRLKEEKEVAVFYTKDRVGNVKAIGLSRMIRYPYDRGVEDLVRTQQPEYKEGIDLCDIIWGFINKSLKDEQQTETEKEKKEYSQKSRVQVSHAICADIISDNDLIKKEGILGEPKASFYPLYLEQPEKSDKFKTYNTASGIAGRKLYKIHQGDSTNDLPVGNNNENATTRFYALPSGKTFQFRINIHNLRPIEIGALLSALTLNATKDAYHNIGMAKAFGFGKIQMDVELSDNFAYSKEHYMYLFEREMTKFTFKEFKQAWADHLSVYGLINILREHEKKEVESLLLNGGDDKKKDEFRKAKKQFVHIPIKGDRINSFITRDDIDEIKMDLIKEEIDPIKAKAEEERKKENYIEAIELYEKVKIKLEAKNINSSEIDPIINDLIKLKTEKEEIEAEKERKKIEIATREKIDAGLSILLEAKFEFGPNVGDYKITGIKRCKGEVDNWLKKKKEPLDERDIEAIEICVRRILTCPDKKERRDLKNYENGLWKLIRTWVGEDRAKVIYNEYGFQ